MDTRGAFDRRTLLSLTTAATIAACTKDDQPKPTPPTPTIPALDPSVEHIVPVLTAIADRLLPADDTGPGAKALGVDTFFRGALADSTFAPLAGMLKRGCAFLTKASQQAHQRPFVAADAAQQDELIRRLVDNEMRPDSFSGPRFIRLVLALTLEGALGDPKHGGNTNRRGWHMVGYAEASRAAGLALKVLP